MSAKRILRIVPVRSARGVYGGPSDTAAAQSRLMRSEDWITPVLLSGYFQNDSPRLLGDIDEYLFQVRNWGPSSGFMFVGSLRFGLGAIREIRRADLVHLTFNREVAAIFCTLICVMLRKPYVVQAHGMLTSRTSRLHRLIDLLVKPLYRHAAAVIALSAAERDDLSRWTAPREDVWVLGNPTVTSLADTPKGDKRVTALYVGRIEYRKRPLDFALAARYALENGWSETYQMVGPLQEADPELVQLSDVLTNMELCPPVSPSHVPATLAVAEVFVSPTWREQWGNVLVMALGLGIPVVLTESAALSSAVREYSAGMVVPDGSPTEIARAVHRLATEPGLAATASAGASKLYAERLSDETVRNTLATIYRSALDGVTS